MRIGTIEFGSNPVFLAPMEDVSDPPFRVLCKRFGADLLYTEFISSGGLIHRAADSLQKLDVWEEERPVAIQIFGGDVDQVTEAARLVETIRPDIIDINFGCPVKKVVRQDAGAGILRDLEKMERITRAVVQSVSCPVTVKTRLGWDAHSIRILEVAEMLQDAGVQALAVHARTRCQLYKGEADWTWLSRLKAHPRLQIPLIGNGDATTPERIQEMFRQTGVDAVMVGRGAIGNPWIFRDTKRLMEQGTVPAPPSWQERIAMVSEHLEMKCAWLGERKGILEMRKMYGGYFRGLRGSAQLRRGLMSCETLEEVLEALAAFERAPDRVDPVPSLP